MNHTVIRWYSVKKLKDNYSFIITWEEVKWCEKHKQSGIIITNKNDRHSYKNKI